MLSTLWMQGTRTAFPFGPDGSITIVNVSDRVEDRRPYRMGALTT